jgi:hypothetical protein
VAGVYWISSATSSRSTTAQGLRVGHRGQAAVVPQVAGPVADPAGQVEATGLEGPLDRRGVSGPEVGGRHRAGQQGDREPRLVRILSRLLRLSCQPVHRLCERQVSLPDSPVDRVLGPGRVGEPPVPLGRHHGGGAQGNPEEFAGQPARFASRRPALGDGTRDGGHERSGAGYGHRLGPGAALGSPLRGRRGGGVRLAGMPGRLVSSRACGSLRSLAGTARAIASIRRRHRDFPCRCYSSSHNAVMPQPFPWR